MIYEATVRFDGAGYTARIGGCTASATSHAELAVQRAAAKALGHTSFTLRKKTAPVPDGRKWKEIWQVIESSEPGDRPQA